MSVATLAAGRRIAQPDTDFEGWFILEWQQASGEWRRIDWFDAWERVVETYGELPTRAVPPRLPAAAGLDVA